MAASKISNNSLKFSFTIFKMLQICLAIFCHIDGILSGILINSIVLLKFLPRLFSSI